MDQFVRAITSGLCVAVVPSVGAQSTVSQPPAPTRILVPMLEDLTFGVFGIGVIQSRTSENRLVHNCVNRHLVFPSGSMRRLCHFWRREVRVAAPLTRHGAWE